MDAMDLKLPDAKYDRALVFFCSMSSHVNGVNER